MVGKKKKEEKHKPMLSTGAIIAIVIGVVFVFGIIFGGGNSEDEEYDKYEIENSYIFNGKSYPTYESYQSAIDYYNDNQKEQEVIQDESDLIYEKADDEWKQYMAILKSDNEKLQETMINYCGDEETKVGIDKCVSFISPVLSSYSIHITNAQNFVKRSADIFSNDIELLGVLDDKAVYVSTVANALNGMINEYNSKQTSSSEMISDEDLIEILKVVAMFI